MLQTPDGVRTTIPLPPVGVHAAAAEIWGLEAMEDAISRSDFEAVPTAAKACPLTRSSWSD